MIVGLSWRVLLLDGVAVWLPESVGEDVKEPVGERVGVGVSERDLVSETDPQLWLRVRLSEEVKVRWSETDRERVRDRVRDCPDAEGEGDVSVRVRLPGLPVAESVRVTEADAVWVLTVRVADESDTVHVVDGDGWEPVALGVEVSSGVGVDVRVTLSEALAVDEADAVAVAVKVPAEGVRVTTAVPDQEWLREGVHE